MDTLLFCDIIESYQGITWVRDQEDEGVKIRIFDSMISGRTVRIDVSYEDISERVGKGYLLQLGIEYAIPSIFPPKENTPPLDPKELWVSRPVTPDEIEKLDG